MEAIGNNNLCGLSSVHLINLFSRNILTGTPRPRRLRARMVKRLISLWWGMGAKGTAVSAARAMDVVRGKKKEVSA